MALCKISIALIGALVSLVAGEFRFEHFKTFGFSEDDADSLIRKPWFGDSLYRSEPSSLVPHYADSPYPYDTLKHGTDPIPAFVSSGLKKIPTEDKAFKKKSIPPFYALPEDPQIKEIVLKSGAPYCQEITAKDTKAAVSASSSAGVDQKQMTCYRCKDPKNGSTYEQCSYTSQPSESSGSREPRSNAAAEKSPDSLTAASHSRSKSKSKSKSKSSEAEKLPETYKFSDDYFHPEASHEIPAEYEKNIDNCERVVKDSMVCMVCKDPKTNGKYEQCSYVAQPNEKAYAYSKSSSFGGAKTKPRAEALKEVIQKTRKIPDEPRHKGHHEEDEEDHHEPEADHLHYKHEAPEESAEHRRSKAADHSGEEDDAHHHAWGEDKEGHGSHYVPDQTYHYPTYKDYKGSYGSYEADDEDDDTPKQSATTKASCKTVEKDGQSCKVCTDPKTGGKSEQCNYSHEPKDKVYKYSKSKSFGYPESQKSSSAGGDGSGGYSSDDDDHEKTADSSEKQERESSASGEDYGGYASQPSTLDYIRSESEKISEKVKGEGDCRKVKRDSMVCTICKDPKTGGDFEQCNYSYDPKDKVFAYSKSKSFGSPTKSSDEDDYSSGSEEHPEETYSLPVIYPTGTSPLDYIPKTSESQLSSVYSTKRPQENEKVLDTKVDTGFYDATIRRAEIEKIVKDIGAEDRSKCKKMYRRGMTCYHCTDEKGFTNEECVYVTEPQVDDSKEQKSVAAGQAIEAATEVEVTVKPTEGTATTSTASTTTTTVKLLEPLMSSSWKSVMTKRRTRETNDKEKPTDKDEVLEVLDEEVAEAEPYDDVAETRAVYDKVLGITLPAYMVKKSPQEIEFDEIVENAKF